MHGRSISWFSVFGEIIYRSFGWNCRTLPPFRTSYHITHYGVFFTQSDFDLYVSTCAFDDIFSGKFLSRLIPTFTFWWNKCIMPQVFVVFVYSLFCLYLSRRERRIALIRRSLFSWALVFHCCRLLQTLRPDTVVQIRPKSLFFKIWDFGWFSVLNTCFIK